MAIDNSFLGSGWSFPPRFNKQLKNVEVVSRENDIEESLQIILSTRVGERIMLPEFGCNLDELLFESINLHLTTRIKDLIETAILYYESRIDVEQIEINTESEIEGVVLIELDYKIRATNSRRNFVYPFYRGEGSDI